MDTRGKLWPGCEPACHGCRHRHLDYPDSLAQKQAYLKRVLAPWVGQLAPVAGVPQDSQLGYRDRVCLNVRWSPEIGWRFGLMRRDELIAIHDCPVHSERVRRLVAVLRETLPDGAGFALAYLHVSGAQAVLILKQRHCEPAIIAATIARLPETGVEGLWLHTHPSAGRRLFARSGWQLAWGREASRDESGFWHGPAAFQQVSPRQYSRALQAAAAYLQPAPRTAVLDLYCGHGSSLACWTAAGASALGVELAGEALRHVARNAATATVLRGTCAQRLPQVEQWWASQTGTRLCFLNPPRSGLEGVVLEALGARLRPQRLAYLSCSAGTLARDLCALELHGYRVDALQAYDFFPQTQHVEVLALLSRAGPAARSA